MKAASRLKIFSSTLHLLTLTITGMLFSNPVMALPSDRDKPVHISSDSADIDDATGIATYRGDVIISQGTTVLKGDVVTIYVSDRKINRIVSQGSSSKQAYYEEEQSDDKGLLKAWANTIDYSLNTELVALTQNARLTQKGDTFTGNNIEYDKRKQLVNAQGSNTTGGRVQMVIQPGQIK